MEAYRYNVDLTDHNTFGITSKADAYVRVEQAEQLVELIESGLPPKVFVLGGGSNVLLMEKIPGLVLHSAIRERKVIKQEGNHTWVELGGGEPWHETVLWTLAQGFGGLENLSLIPGTVGAAPIQNIGAYGVELADVFDQLEAIHLQSGETMVFGKSACDFDYRYSIFKGPEKGHWFITKVILKLTNRDHHLSLDYSAIRQTLEAYDVHSPTIQDISQAVIAIRQSKLPDPATIGNAGSFFKNPIVDQDRWTLLHNTYPQMPFYPQPDQQYKIAAGWLVEQCGWKGKKVGHTGAYAQQALVLVNYGGATGEEVLQLSAAIQASVQEKFGIGLEREVLVVG